ncbi:hypothetical protein SGRIM128S_06504 [Streptomyces griseomycini]
MVTVVSAMTWLPRPRTTPSPMRRIGSGPRSRPGIRPAVRVTCSPTMQWAPTWIQGSPKIVPSGKASLVPVPMEPKRKRPGCSAVTEPVRCTQDQPAWTARCARRRDQDENVFLLFGTRSP